MAAPVPRTPGEMAAGRVRGRAPSTHCASVATSAQSGRLSGVTSPQPVSGPPRELLARLRSWWNDPEGAPLVVATSGSTGEPKRVRLSRRALAASATATASRLGGPGQWLLDLPVERVAGLQVRVRSVGARTAAVVARTAGSRRA